MAEWFAEGLLSSSGAYIFERLASRNLRDYFRRGKLDDKLVEELESTLDSINQVLDDAEIKQYQIPKVKKWLGDVKHAMYEADQLLDEIATDAPLKKLKAESQPSTSNIFNFIPTFINPFESRIKKLIMSLHSLVEKKDELELKNQTCASKDGLVSWKPSERLSTTALVDESTIYGRDVHKEKLIKLLLEGNDSGNQVPPIISIVGLGGMGKTTLAKLVYNDEKIKEHFKLKAWVYVSESFNDVGLTKAILESFKFSANGENLNLLQEQLQHELTGKKYLLVLDDIWNANVDYWEQLLLPFNHGSSGSKIIVTTREKEAANVLNSTLFDLEQLDKSNCWSLFVKQAFHNKNVHEYPNLEPIGKKIVDKCRGLPLAVKTLGQLLRRKFSEEEWKKILETDMWQLSDKDSNINPVLRLSYHNLPSNQKGCFAYCSIFPKGYSFNKDGLIKLWMAEGLLKCCGAGKSEEDFGNEIFRDLESISFFQKSLYDNDKFVMHDLVNDLTKSVSGEFCMQIEGSRVEGITEKTRHVWLPLQYLNCRDKLLESICECKGLRSLIVERNRATLISNNVQHDLFSRLTCLRMLTFRGCGLSELVDEIGNLKLLRYLDLSWTKIKSLPDTICMLYNLQTLLLKGCDNLTELPSNFSKLINLRHLELPSDHYDRPCIKKTPKNIGKLNKLQSLPLIIHGSVLKELEKLNHLRGRIYIEGLGNVIDPADAVMANLKDKKYLEELHMKFYERIEEMNDSVVERNVSVFEALEPNSNLKRLSIGKYNGNYFPNWLRGSHLPNLVSLRLYDCPQLESFPRGGLPSNLRWLVIENCPKLIASREEWGLFQLNSLEYFSVSDEFENVESFPEENLLPPTLIGLYLIKCSKLRIMNYKGFLHLNSLVRLLITNCRSLESLPEEALQLSSLSQLRIRNCPLISEKYKKEGGERWHTISHIPYVFT